MKFSEIKSAVKHLLKTSKCLQCMNKYNIEGISVLATTNTEGLFEITCSHCKASTIVTVFSSPEIEIKSEPGINNRKHQTISKDDVLDIKNFLNKFDGNFKKLFIKE